jgi:peptide/nickel transport system permease protein
MLRFIALRVLFLIPVLLGATIIVFVLVRLTPGDPTQALLGPNATEAGRAALRLKLGLNDPLYIQYWKWLRLALQGDLGVSIELQTSVFSVVVERFKNTLILGGVSGLLGLLIGIAAGVVSAVKKNSVFDRLVLFVSVLGVSMPGYWLSVVLIYVFSVKLGWLPTGQMYSVTGDRGTFDLLRHLILPVIAALVVPAALIARFARTAMLELMGQDFLTGLRAKGLTERRVLYQHVFRNALPPIVSMSGIQIGYQILGQMLFIEIVFGWPGIGLQIFDSVAARDFPMIAGIVLLASLVFIVVNLLMDIVTHLLTPRLRLRASF